MAKKTLEQYQKEFEKYKEGYYSLTEEEIPQYEKLAFNCIADYPDENLGYTEFGYAIKNLYHIDYEKFEKKLDYLYNLTKENNKYIITEEFLLNEISSVNYAGLPEELYMEEKKEFATVYLYCGFHNMGSGFYLDAAQYFKTAWELGIDYNKFIKILNPKFECIVIKDNHCISDLTINNIDKCNEIYFVGENGVGKTLLLQSIINNFENGLQNIQDSSANESGEFPHNYLNLFAYGTARFRTGSKKDDFYDKTGYGTLFDRNKVLTHPILFFENILLKKYQNEIQLELDTVLRSFEKIIDFDDSKSFRIEQKGSKFIFYEQNTPIEFEHLAEGYRSVLIWLCDLLSRLINNQPYIKDLEDFYGIVLVDEIDMFLHPKWEQKIVKKLREKLPNIQWFFTTHSPMLILGASEDAVFYKLYKENGKTKISEPWTGKDIMHLMANGIITSPLFDLPSARMKNLKDLSKMDTSSDFWTGKIHEKIQQQIEAEKAKGKVYFSKQEVDNFVEWAISEIDREVEDDKSEN